MTPRYASTVMRIFTVLTILCCVCGSGISGTVWAATASPAASPTATAETAPLGTTSTTSTLKKAPIPDAPAATPPPWAVDGIDVGAVVQSLTVEQKVGQLLLLGFGGTEMDGTISTFLDEMQPGGVALFSRNIDGPAQAMRLIREVRQHDPVVGGLSLPQFVAVDQEGGNVTRLKEDAVILPSAMALGAADDVDLAYDVGLTLGTDLLAWGFTMNLAPVLDVSSNPKNPVIGIRSFGGDPDRVGDIGVAYVEGLNAAGVVAVAKHFPGHGDTDTDSHYALPILQHDRARLDAVELRPFARAFAEGLPAIMTAHIALPLIAEGKDVPATVSGKVLTGVLREDLGYDGLVITDGLEMQGIVDRYGAGEAAVRAVVAGADMVMVLWFPEKKREVREHLLAAVASGRIPPSRLNQAVHRVLYAKARAGLFSRQLLPTELALRQVSQQDRSAVDDVARRAITLVRNRDDVIPLKASSKIVVAGAQPAMLASLRRQLGAQTVPLAFAPTKRRTASDIEKIVSLGRGADVVVVGVHSGDHVAVVRAVQARLPDVKVVAVSFGSPWLIRAFPGVDAYLCAFGWRNDSAIAVADVLAGKRKAVGHLPVSLSKSDDARPTLSDVEARPAVKPGEAETQVTAAHGPRATAGGT